MTSLRSMAAATAAAGLAVAGLAGCTSSKADQQPAPAPAPASTGVISPPKLTAVPTLKKEKGIAADTTMADCSAAKGPVKANGTVKNTSGKSSDLVVVVSWIVPQGSDVVARGVAVVKGAEPGSEHKWTVASDVKVDQQVQCVLSARRGAIAKA
ncbi:hypothetical protein [uncultured Friedmanniella sp.]|uniref:hypothetical protein n=1 Tax=uncultured Friedmanniella sp. TaxID=335381 RepID=UPI0035CC4322